MLTSRQLFLDISATRADDLKTGIQRVVRAAVWEILHDPPPGYRAEPVYLSLVDEQWQYRHARAWTCQALGVPHDWLSDEVVQPAAGDVLLILDFTGSLATAAGRSGYFQELRNDGVEIQFVVYDLLPVLMPEVFPPGLFDFCDWLEVVLRYADVAVCISQTVANQLESWNRAHGPARPLPLRITWFHLGGDLDRSIPTRGLPSDAAHLLHRLAARPTFLMVGTVEPRKAHLQALNAFDQLWKDDVDANLVIVGCAGWRQLPDDMRRTIPETIRRLRGHRERGQRLFWLEGISDEYLEKVYAASTCLLAASLGEGFGLPLIEAARHGLPILARDIPVFREVAGERATYFSGTAPADLAAAVAQWLEQHARGATPSSDGMQCLVWKQSVAQLLSGIPRHPRRS